MTNKHYLFIPILGISLISQAAFSQDDTLDITIRVMEENEEPADFVQRLELPPPESFGLSMQNDTAVSLSLDEAVANTRDDIADTANESEASKINTILDNISINGTGTQPDADTIGNLPNQVVDILDDNLPLNTDLTGTVDDTTGEIVDVTNGILDDLDDDAGNLADVTDGLGDITEDVGNTTDDVTDDIVDATLDDTLGDSLDNINANINDSINDSVNDSVNDIDSTDDLTTGLDDIGESLEADAIEIPQNLTDGL